ncbi:hypothetical protein [Hymenobacter sublimis]|uniref:DNA-directed DNA polymerase family A palm domain-containing protein n=1 Tax=Hymenobacter sublimis TaxID=2933777 RepID=A0ABY4J6S8_9BACT|nr:hypothetical protein [Hymenobacter sublimis]UPL48530.1 hypothetical protein MWH26_15220 [Hymenobacter sublimis]
MLSLEKDSTLILAKVSRGQRVYIPSGLNTRVLLSSKNQKWLNHLDKFNYLLSYLYFIRATHVKYRKNDFIPLHAATFRQYVGRRLAADIVSFWIEQGVIEENAQYIVGKKSKGYRFTSEYRNRKFIDVGVIDERFEKRLRTLEARRQSTFDTSYTPHAFLSFNLHELRIEAERAIHYLNCEALLADAVEDANVIFSEQHLVIKTVEERRFWIKRDTTGNRIHNNLTNLRADMRQFLYLETGEQLVNLDIRNSQPLILCVLLKKHFDKQMPVDMLAYIEQCEKGQLYEALMDHFDLPIAERTEKARKAFKKRVFGNVFYGKNSTAPNKKDWRLFAELYPSVAGFIYDRKKHDYTQLPIDMQRMEAEIMIDGVIGEIAKGYYPQDFFALTIHDSVVTTRENAEYVKYLMQLEFAKFGINPTIQQENLN